MLRTLCTAHLPETVVRRPDPLQSLASLDASASGPLPYTERLLDLVAAFEWDGIDQDLDICDVDDPAAAMEATAQWCADTLYPAAREELEAWRNPPAGRPPGYFEALDVSWTKPQSRMPMSYNTEYAGEADPQPGQVDVDFDDIGFVDVRYERQRMRRLRNLHNFDAVKPPYQLTSLEWTTPVQAVANHEPPVADDSSDSDSS